MRRGGVLQALRFSVCQEISPNLPISPIRFREIGLTRAGSYILGGMGMGVRIIFIGGKGKGGVCDVCGVT